MDQDPLQGNLFAVADRKATPTTPVERFGAFTDNMRLPVHRWFRYSAGFAADWVKEVVGSSDLAANDIVLDPFAGSGTTLLACDEIGVPSVGIEAHPFVARVTKTKLSWAVAPEALQTHASTVLDLARSSRATINVENELLSRCYAAGDLNALARIKRAIESTPAANKRVNDLGWLALTSILRECSGVGTAQWQYILPSKSKARTGEPFGAFCRKIQFMCTDMAYMQTKQRRSRSKILHKDSRADIDALHGRVGLVITSPPYPNNYDYADATRLEMTFWGEVQGWGDLQSKVRHRLVRSCSQHSLAERLQLEALLESPAIEPIRDELSAVCTQLAEIRTAKGGKKTYHTMIAAYFVDLAITWQRLRAYCRDGAKVLFIVGDSAPYGVYVPVDDWLGRLACAAGFHSFEFAKLRDRNIKWKNRKHRVPLKEGILTVRG